MLSPITPQEHYPELAKAIGLPDVYLKREDLHPLGSHKGRSIPVMIDHYYRNGDRNFVISSSGNAALAAALYIQGLNKKNAGNASALTNLGIFVGNHVNKHKLEKLRAIAQADSCIRVLIKERPIQALTLATQEGARSLRQSTDPMALTGYASLAAELSSIKNLSAVFIATSSGTTAQALASYFLDNKMPVQVHIVQTSSCHPMSDEFETYSGPDELSIADAIVNQSALRKAALIPLLKKSQGFGSVASNDEITTAQELVLKHTGLNISTNSALSVAGAMQAAMSDKEIKGAVVCILGGE